MALPNGATKRTGVHATGQPDTPVEVITALLHSALQSGSVEDIKKQLQQAYDVVAGLDPYLESVSTPPSAVRVAMLVCMSMRSRSFSYTSAAAKPVNGLRCVRV